LNIVGRNFKDKRAGINGTILMLKPVITIGSPVLAAMEEPTIPASTQPVEIDEDVREEYWTKIRKMPEAKRARGRTE
jgi:hypothetical protein